MPTDARDDATPDLTLYTDADARAIWARAAQLQAEADDDVRRAYGAPARAEPPAPPSEPVPVAAPAGMFLAHEVRDAAREAGIDAACVALAMAEHEAADRETALVPSDDDVRRFVRDLGTAAGSVRATGVLAGDRDVVVARLRAALGRSPWLLTFDGRLAAQGGAGEVLRFRLPRWGTEVDGESTMQNGFVYHANRIGVGALHVHVAPRGTREHPACEVTLVADLRPGAWFNAGFMGVVRAAMPPLTALAGALLAGAAVGPGIASLTALAGAALGGVGGAALVAGVRAIMRWEQRTAMHALARSLDAMLRAALHDGALHDGTASSRASAVAAAPALPRRATDHDGNAFVLA